MTAQAPPGVPPLNAMPTAVVFDMDGLLLDTERLHGRSVRATCGALGFEISEELLLSMVGGTWDANRERLLAAYGPGFPVKKFQTECRTHFTALCTEGIALRPGVLEIFSFFEERGIPLAVATSTVKITATHHLRQAGLLDRLTTVVCRDDVKEGKPHPEPYLEAAKRLAVAPADCLALEDSHSGARSAIAAGFRTILVPDMVPATPEIATHCAHVARDLNEVRHILAELVVK